MCTRFNQYFPSTGLLLALLFLRVSVASGFRFWAGFGLYIAGILLLAAAVAAFCAPSPNGMNQGGVYRFSRNPMYGAYFLLFLGCALLARSWLLLGLTLCLQFSAHWIVKAEERWCVEAFGESYVEYMKQIRRFWAEGIEEENRLGCLRIALQR